MWCSYEAIILSLAMVRLRFCYIWIFFHLIITIFVLGNTSFLIRKTLHQWNLSWCHSFPMIHSQDTGYVKQKTIECSNCLGKTYHLLVPFRVLWSWWQTCSVEQPYFTLNKENFYQLKTNFVNPVSTACSRSLLANDCHSHCFYWQVTPPVH